MRVDLSLTRYTAGASDDVIFEIRDASAGGPGASTLFSHVIDIDSLDVGGVVHTAFSIDVSGADLSFATGDMFSVVLGRAPGADTDVGNWAFWKHSLDFSGGFVTHDQGATWSSGHDSYGFALRTFMEPVTVPEPVAVPEPGMLVLLGAALVCVGHLRLRSQKS